VSELDALDPVTETVKLSSGTTVVVETLKARQFFKLLRILTHGALPLVSEGSIFRLDPNEDPDIFGKRLLSIVVLAIPDAEDETIEFLKSMVRPSGLIERRNLNKRDFERNTALWDAVNIELDNPELDDLISLVEAIVRREAADIQALGKRLMSLFRVAQKTGQIPGTSPSPNLPASTERSSAASPAPSTSSPTSTDGPTQTSENSASDGFVNVSLPFENAVSTAPGSDSNG
jgi:hypothetical protein